ncbi:MAG: HDOD domain-containing protein [Deltaproteobacteria bacterium]|nr:HDOD domain-containing protein [Deltaproteobacteria bacterium]
MAALAVELSLLERISAALENRLTLGSVELPMLPQVAAEVMAMATDPETDAARLSKLIHRDAALAGAVLKLANSAAQATRMPIASLPQAVARLGMATVSGIAVASSLQGGVFQVRGQEALLAAIWRHSLASASFAQEIARHLRNNVEAAYLCGLLHQVGRPLVLQLAVGAAGSEVGRLDERDFFELFARHERAFGLMLGERWKLAPTVLCAIAHHHEPPLAPRFIKEVLTCALAGALASHALLPEDLDAEASLDLLRCHPSLEALNLYPEDLDALLVHQKTICALVSAIH